MTPFDPEFDRPVPKVIQKSAITRAIGRPTPLMIVLIVAWFCVLWSFGLFIVFFGLVAWMLGGLLVIAVASIPSLLGYWLFGLYDRLVIVFRNASRWPDEQN